MNAIIKQVDIIELKGPYTTHTFKGQKAMASSLFIVKGSAKPAILLAVAACMLGDYEEVDGRHTYAIHVPNDDNPIIIRAYV